MHFKAGRFFFVFLSNNARFRMRKACGNHWAILQSTINVGDLTNWHNTISSNWFQLVIVGNSIEGMKTTRKYMVRREEHQIKYETQLADINCVAVHIWIDPVMDK